MILASVPNCTSNKVKSLDIIFPRDLCNNWQLSWFQLN